jgi:NitT/TauT family transport system ATP-binding protein
MNQPIISFHHVSKTFDAGRTLALKDINFSVDHGMFLCIVGPSGCGKSTVLKIIAGLDAPTSGEVEKPQDVSMIFQNGALFPWLTVYDNVAFGLKAKYEGLRHIEQEAFKYIEMTGLNDHIDKFPRELSGGQRQRVGIARALAVNPDVLLLDEPFSALDTATTEELHKDLLKIWKQTNKTIVMVSHSIEEAVTLADSIMLMKAGNVEDTFPIPLPRPRREQESLFMHDVQNIRNRFFK